MSSEFNIVPDMANLILGCTYRGKVCTYTTLLLPSLFSNFHNNLLQKGEDFHKVSTLCVLHDTKLIKLEKGGLFSGLKVSLP